MPFNFVCKLIDYIRQIELIQLNSQLDESSLCNKQKLNLIIEDLYECKWILFKFFIEIKKLIFLFSK